jgi:hypothetical protein|tara:strand:- start:5036 stop:5509 length:474 start_codon:yes stop_codon:yes gene_type:complete
MAAAVSKWTTIGVNTGDPAAQGLNTNIVAGSDGQVRHECLVWLDGTDPIYTNNFDWVINGDCTLVLNGTLNDITADAGNVDVDMEGSLDGTNYIKLADLATWNAGGGAQTETVGLAVYDFDGKGRMPFMRLAFDCGSDANCTAVGNHIKATLIMHNG